VHRLEHPTKLLHSILEKLYDMELISEESLLEWERSTDPEEQKGKGVALKSCTQFFKWLQEADEEGEDETKVRDLAPCVSIARLCEVGEVDLWIFGILKLNSDWQKKRAFVFVFKSSCPEISFVAPKKEKFTK
jgi:hypothetical protein